MGEHDLRNFIWVWFIILLIWQNPCRDFLLIICMSNIYHQISQLSKYSSEMTINCNFRSYIEVSHTSLVAENPQRSKFETYVLPYPGSEIPTNFLCTQISSSLRFLVHWDRVLQTEKNYHCNKLVWNQITLW